MSNLQFQNDLDKLVEILPDRIRRLIDYSAMEDVIEIVLDIGRMPEIRHSNGKIEYLGTSEIGYDDIDYITSRVQEFTSDNRSGIAGTLHRISAIRNRQGNFVRSINYHNSFTKFVRHQSWNFSQLGSFTDTGFT